jgi:glutathione S-transferase
LIDASSAGRHHRRTQFADSDGALASPTIAASIAIAEARMLTLFDYLPSQNAYKVRLLLNHLGKPYRTELVSIFEGMAHHPDYAQINPTGAVPAIRLDDGRVLAESTAILLYLAQGSVYLPDDPFLRAKVTQWLSFENDYLQNSIGSLRYWRLTDKLSRRPAALVEGKRAMAMKVLRILDRELSQAPFLVDERYSIADMGCFAYTHLARDADLPLDDFRQVCEWIDRVRAQPGFLDRTYPYSIDPHAQGELP